MAHYEGLKSDQLPPLPKKKLPRIVLYNLGQVLAVPIKRLFRRKPIVDGWTIKMEIGVNCFRYLLENDMKISRDIEITITKSANKSLLKRIQTTPFQASGFSGYWIGDVPETGNDPIVLYIHGGGFCMCTALTYLSGIHEIMQNVRKRTQKNILVFALEYKRAPEAKIKESVAAFKYLRETFPNRKLIVLGESAGGNLVLSTILDLKQEYSKTSDDVDVKNGPYPDIAIAISPWVELVANLDDEYDKRNRESDFITALQLVHFVRNYLPDPSRDTANPFASPATGDFSKTCPILVHYGAEEFMTPEIDRFVERLRTQQSTDTKIVKENMAPHITPLISSWFGAISQRGIDAIADFIISHVYKSDGQ